MRVLLPVLLLAACRPVPLTHVQSFGEAADTLADSSSKAFLVINSAGSEQAAQALLVTPPTNDAEATALWNALDKALDEGLIPPSGLTERQALLSKLGDYGAALGALAGADLAADLEQKSSRLFDTIITLNQGVADIAGQDPVLTRGAILSVQKAISTVGGALLEGKRRKELVTLIVQTDPVVQAAAKLLAKDLSPDAPLALATHGLLTNRIVLIQAAYNIGSDKMTYDQRESLIDKVRTLHVERAQIDDLYRSASSAATAMGAAHTALVAAATDKSWTSEEFLSQLSTMTKYVSQLKSINESLGLASQKK